MDWNTLGSLAIGSLITVLVSGYYYRRASEDLRHAAEELKQQNTDLKRLNGLTLRILEEAGLLPENVEVTKDENGNPTGGLTYKLDAAATMKSTTSLDMKVTRRNGLSNPTQQPPEGNEPERDGTGA